MGRGDLSCERLAGGLEAGEREFHRRSGHGCGEHLQVRSPASGSTRDILLRGDLQLKGQVRAAPQIGADHRGQMPADRPFGLAGTAPGIGQRARRLALGDAAVDRNPAIVAVQTCCAALFQFDTPGGQPLRQAVGLGEK